MSNKFSRSLASILCSRLGGNIGHNDNSILEELCDNSLDAFNDSDNKNVYFATYNCEDSDEELEEDYNKTYLEVLDNANGISNINNILDGSKGKINKIGCKNSGFLDSLAYLSKLDGEHTILTKINNVYCGLIITFDDFIKEYNTQSDSNDTIDYDKLDMILTNNISNINNKTIKQLLKDKKNSNILEKFKKQKSGTYLKIQLNKDHYDILENININYFQYKYNTKLNLSINEEAITINDVNTICKTDKYKPAEVDLYISKCLDYTLYKIVNNINKEVEYYSKQHNSKSLLRNFSFTFSESTKNLVVIIHPS